MRTFASHWVVCGPEATVSVEKLLPFLRSLFPYRTDGQCRTIAGRIWRAGDHGLTFEGYVFYRRVVPERRDMIADYITSGGVDPIVEENDFFHKLNGRKCVK